MHDELFKKRAIVARYRAGPFVEARERFLQQASADGYSRSMLERIAWVLLTTAKAVESQGGSISSTRLRSLLDRRIRLGNGRQPSQYTASLIRRCGEDWLRSIGALLPDSVQPPWFARELDGFTVYMRIERGLSPVTIATREERRPAFRDRRGHPAHLREARLRRRSASWRGAPSQDLRCRPTSIAAPHPRHKVLQDSHCPDQRRTERRPEGIRRNPPIERRR